MRRSSVRASTRVSGAGAAAAPACPNGNLCNLGGPVMGNVVVYNIYWVPSGITSPNQGLINRFTQDLGGPFTAMLSQYGVSNRVNYGGSWVDPTDYPTTTHSGVPVIQDGDLQASVVRAANANSNWKAPGLGTLYMVYLGTHTELCSPQIGCTYNGDFCAYHNAFDQSGSTFVYGAMPFDGDRLNGCGIQITHEPDSSGSPGPNGDTANDAEVSTASHEIFEALTDPFPISNPAWTNGANPADPSFLKGEIGDLCAYVFNPDSDHGNVTLNGDRYFLQEEWDNATSSCIIPGDAIVARATNQGCETNVLDANDDGSTGNVALPFTLNFFGNQYSSLWVNNNGNVTFDSPLATYTPFSLLSAGRVIIAPYFSDVDTRGQSPVPSGLVTYGSTTFGGRTAFCVNWRNVGYFGSHTDKLNSFQLLLVDQGSGDFNIVFNYDRVQWETGDASGGSNGFGGGSARAGFSNGSSNSLEIFGSGTNGALLDSGPAALTAGSHGSTTPGRYIFEVRNGNNAGGATIAGQITDTATPANPVSGALVQACGGFFSTIVCDLTHSTSQGGYSITGLPAGLYEVTVSPPAGSPLFQQSKPTILFPNGTANLDFALDGPQPLPAGTTIGGAQNGDGTPVLYWQSTIPLTTHGCAGGSASYTVTAEDSQTGASAQRSGNLTEQPPGSGNYTGSIPPLYPLHGAGTVSITITCPNPSDDRTFSFDVYIDPSGQILDTDGNPVAGATVTLLRSDDPGGPFDAVPNGSAVMSPGNRSNPSTSGADGVFGWDVVEGYYEVTASKQGCHAPGDPESLAVQSPVLTIPPAATGVTLTLDCATQQPQTITFPQQGPYPYGTASVQLGATASSGLPVSYTIVSGPCTVTGSTLMPHGAGSCVVAANQAGNDSYLPAPEVRRTIQISKAPLTVTGTTVHWLAALKLGRLVLSATVLNAAVGGPAPGLQVKFTLRNFLGYTFGCTAVTDLHGVATCSVRNGNALLIRPRAYSITVPASANYLAGSGSGRIVYP